MPQLQGDKVGEEKAQEQALRQSIKIRLASLASHVTFPEQPAPKSPTAEQDDVKKLGQEICGVLQSAWKKTGSLDLLRQEQDEVVQAAPEDEMETVRTNLNSLMKDALLTGQLATALEELKTKSEEPLRITDIHAIKAKLKKLLREALDKGILASKVFKLKLIPKAPPPPPESPPDEMDVLKLRLREVLQHAAEAGRLAEALAWLRSGPAEGVQETMRPLQNTLTEASLPGTLAETLRSLEQVMIQATLYLPELQLSLLPQEKCYQTQLYRQVLRKLQAEVDELRRDNAALKEQKTKGDTAEVEKGTLQNQMRSAIEEADRKVEHLKSELESEKVAKADLEKQLREDLQKADDELKRLSAELESEKGRAHVVYAATSTATQTGPLAELGHVEDLCYMVRVLWDELHPPKVGSEGDDNR